MAELAAITGRPRPPADLIATESLAIDRFVPAPELLDWIRGQYLADSGALYTEDHAHLQNAAIGCLWTTAENSRHGRRIVGMAELTERARHQGKWIKARAEQQLRDWFGDVPTFLLIFDALYCDPLEDASFCALVDHELYHCGQETDEFGQPKFNAVTGEAKWTIRGHDVEEFTGVVRRFGAEAAGDAVVDLVIAAASQPTIARANVARACGTCLKLAA